LLDLLFDENQVALSPHGFDSRVKSWWMEQPAARSTSTPRSPSRCTSVGLAQGASVGMAAPTSCSGSGLGKEMPAQCYGVFSNSYQLCGARCAFLLPGRNLQCWVTWKISQGFGIPKQWGKLFSSWSWSPVANLISYKAWKCNRASSCSSQRLLIFFFYLTQIQKSLAVLKQMFLTMKTKQISCRCSNAVVAVRRKMQRIVWVCLIQACWVADLSKSQICISYISRNPGSVYTGFVCALGTAGIELQCQKHSAWVRSVGLLGHC